MRPSDPAVLQYTKEIGARIRRRVALEAIESVEKASCRMASEVRAPFQESFVLARRSLRV
jgi:hypothetical protein